MLSHPGGPVVPNGGATSDTRKMRLRNKASLSPATNLVAVHAIEMRSMLRATPVQAPAIIGDIRLHILMEIWRAAGQLLRASGGGGELSRRNPLQGVVAAYLRGPFCLTACSFASQVRTPPRSVTHPRCAVHTDASVLGPVPLIVQGVEHGTPDGRRL